MDSGLNGSRTTPGALAARVGRVIGIAAEGVALSIAIAIVGVVIVLVASHVIGAILIVAAVAVAAFFRDPDRFPARTDGVVLSAADGRVTDIIETEIPGLSGVRCRRVAVFMSPLNVHVNRAPIGGEVVRIEHTAGKFSAAFRDVASEHNERTLTVFADANGRSFAIMQIAGYLARRIICRLHIHDRIEPAQRVGLIMFGSRVDHYFPLEFEPTVSIGDRVRAGESVLAERREEQWKS